MTEEATLQKGKIMNLDKKNSSEKMLETAKQLRETAMELEQAAEKLALTESLLFLDTKDVASFFQTDFAWKFVLLGTEFRLEGVPLTTQATRFQEVSVGKSGLTGIEMGNLFAEVRDQLDYPWFYRDIDKGQVYFAIIGPYRLVNLWEKLPKLKLSVSDQENMVARIQDMITEKKAELAKAKAEGEKLVNDLKEVQHILMF